jgi:hypothetical protein
VAVTCCYENIFLISIFRQSCVTNRDVACLAR